MTIASAHADMDVFISGDEKGVASTDGALGSTEAAADGEREGLCPAQTPTVDDLRDSEGASLVHRDPRTMPAVVFRRGFLSPEERAALAARPRFYSMAWLVPAGTPAADPADDLFPL